MSDRPRANSSQPAGQSQPEQEQPAVKEHASAPHLKPATAHNKTRDRQSSFVEESVSFVGAISFPANFHSSFAEGTEDGEGSVFDASEGLGSLGAIFSLWNTMVGSTVLFLPYGFQQAGPFVGMLVASLSAGCSLFTAITIADYGGQSNDYANICGSVLGPWSRHLLTASSLLIWSGVLIVYQILMADSLVNLIKLGVDGFNITWGAFLVIGLMFVPCHLKDITVLIKVNGWGIVSVVYLLFFMTYESITYFMDGKAPSASSTISHSMENIEITGAGVLCGMLGAGYFSHNALLPIIKNKVNPEKNRRDCAIAYVLVLASYLIAGLLPSLAFADSDGNSPMGDTQNFLLIAPLKTKTLAYIAQGMLAVQLFTVWPLILTLIRSTWFENIYGDPWPSFKHVLAHNVIYMIGSTFGTIVLDDVVGTLLSYVAALSGLVYMYLLPFLMIYWGTKHNKETEEDKMSQDLLYDETILSDSPDGSQELYTHRKIARPQLMLVTSCIVVALGAGMLFLPFIGKLYDTSS